MSDASFLGVIQKIVQKTVEGLRMAEMETGTVTSVSPLSIQTDVSRPFIPNAALILTSEVKERIVNVEGGAGGTVQVHESLKAGDKVLMLRVSHGQRYIILSKL